MKKTLLLALGAGMCMATVTAQPFKQAGKENNLQLLFAPLGSNPISLNDGGIMFRKFNATGTAAFRIGLNIGSSSETIVLVQAADSMSGLYPDTLPQFGYTLVPGLNPQADEINKESSFTIRPGYEMHCPGTDRISPYWGAELFFTKATTKSETDEIRQGNYSATVIDSLFVFGEPPVIVNNPYTTYTVKSKGSSTTFGINLIAGFDFYFTKSLSLGAELNFGYSSTKWSDLETEYIKNTTSTTGDQNVDPDIFTTTTTSSNSVTSAPDQKRGKSSGFGPGVVGKLKLGWLF